MAINNTVTKKVYIGDGVTRVFSYPFPISTSDGSDIGVFITDLGGTVSQMLSGYTVDTIAKQVTYPLVPVPPLVPDPPLSAGKKITLMRITPLTQLLALVDGGDWSAESVDNALDKLTMIAQEQGEQLSRAVLATVDQTQATDIVTQVMTAASNASSSASSSASSATASATSASNAAASATAAAASAVTAAQIVGSVTPIPATLLTTQGDIIFRDASGPQKLGAGTSGQIFTTKGPTANPVYQDNVKTVSFNFAAPANGEVAPKYVVKQACTANYIDVQCNVAPSAAVTFVLYRNGTTSLASFGVSTTSTTNSMTPAILTSGDTLHVAISGNSNSISGVNFEVKLVMQ